jgi:hypothetical protein
MKKKRFGQENGGIGKNGRFGQRRLFLVYYESFWACRSL